MMHRTPDTSSALDTHITGDQLADRFYLRQLEGEATIGDIRSQLGALLHDVQHDEEATKRMGQIKKGVDEVAGGGSHDGVSLKDDLGANVLGQNRLGTKASVLRRDQMNPDDVINHTKYSIDTVLHENSEKLGHAGQDPAAAYTIAVVDESGKFHGAVTGFEGNVVANVSAHLGEQREGLPEEVYQEGVDLVKTMGRETVDSYMRKGGANVGKHLQVEMWRTQPGITFERMLEQGAAVGMSEEQIVEAATELGKVPNLSPVALSLSA